jgi:hypothetical protein
MPDCFVDTLKLCLVHSKNAPRIATAIIYLKKRIELMDTPFFINGIPNNGFNPYVIPVMTPAG